VRSAQSPAPWRGGGSPGHRGGVGAASWRHCSM